MGSDGGSKQASFHFTDMNRLEFKQSLHFWPMYRVGTSGCRHSSQGHWMLEGWPKVDGEEIKGRMVAHPFISSCGWCHEAGFCLTFY